MLWRRFEGIVLPKAGYIQIMQVSIDRERNSLHSRTRLTDTQRFLSFLSPGISEKESRQLIERDWMADNGGINTDVGLRMCLGAKIESCPRRQWTEAALGTASSSSPTSG